jgi:uncharacterized protein (DUF486 family)
MKVLEFIIFIFLISISSIIYCFANFYNKLPSTKNETFLKILLMSLLFAFFEYLFKVPAMYYYGKNINSIMTYTFILVTIFIALTVFSKYILKEKVHNITYLTLLLVILILIGHNYIISKIKKE